jgi:lipooligosaccharide transport system ATP-binding protein
VAVDGIDLRIPRGVCFGLLGPNGAGKTTAIRMIQCVSPVTEGSLTVLGMDVDREGRAIKARLGVVPQEDNLDPDFSVRGNLLVYSRFFHVPRAEAEKRADELLAFLNLTEKRDARIAELSGGMKRRLIVARALINDPDLLVLDEPTTGLDPQARHALWDTIRRLRRSGKTILLTTHYMDEAEMLCDSLVVVDQGRVLEQGAPRELIRKHAGSEAVEFVLDDDEAGLDAIAADLESQGVPHERLPDRVIAYGEEMEAVQIRIRDSHNVQESVLRRATLEDVFLRLTGRALRE